MGFWRDRPNNERRQLAAACRWLGHQPAVEDAHGNVSMRLPYARDSYLKSMLIKPSGIALGDITPRKLVEIDFFDHPKSLVVDSPANLRPSVDTIHHAAIYVKNLLVNAICHTHSPYATAFAIAGLDIVCCSTEQADYFGSDIKCVETSMDPDGWSESLDAFNLKGHDAFLLKHHGVITTGRTPDEAVKRAAHVEQVAKKTWLSMALCGPISLPSDVQVAWHLRYHTKYGQ